MSTLILCFKQIRADFDAGFQVAEVKCQLEVTGIKQTIKVELELRALRVIVELGGIMNGRGRKNRPKIGLFSIPPTPALRSTWWVDHPDV